MRHCLDLLDAAAALRGWVPGPQSQHQKLSGHKGRQMGWHGMRWNGPCMKLLLRDGAPSGLVAAIAPALIFQWTGSCTYSAYPLLPVPSEVCEDLGLEVAAKMMHLQAPL